MPLLRSLAAIAGGFAVMAFLIAVTTLGTRWLAPSLRRMPPARGAQLFNLIASSLYAASGGGATAILAPISPLVHALILAMIVLLVSAVAASELRGEVRGFYPLALAVLPSLAALGGGILTVLYR